jgi:hypothetical protein
VVLSSADHPDILLPHKDITVGEIPLALMLALMLLSAGGAEQCRLSGD